jgi:hypothetical protein
LDRRLDGPQSRSGRGGEEKNSQPLPGIESPNPNYPARSQLLYRLSYFDAFSIQNDLKQGDASSPLFFNSALEYVIRKDWIGMELS